MLNKKERVLDFIAYLINKYEYYFHPVNYYFAQKTAVKFFQNEIFKDVIDDYYLFLSKYISFEINNDELIDFDDFSDFVNFTNHNKILNFIRTNINHLYNKDNKFDIPDDEYNRFSKEYFDLFLLNRKVFISYFYKKIFFLEESINSKLNKQIDKIKSYKIYFDNDYSGFKEYMNNYYKTKLNNHLFKFDIQLVGFLDSKSFFINKNESLVKYLKELNSISDFKKIKYYSEDKIKIKNMYSIIFENVEKISNNFNLEESSYTNIVLSRFKDYNVYLKGKGFNDEAISSIINVLLKSKLKKTRFINLNFKVDLFRFLYFTYYFDYYNDIKKNKLLDEKDFEKVIEHIELFKDDENLNIEMKRNYQSNNNYAPFKATERVKHLIELIETELLISKDLLKKQP